VTDAWAATPVRLEVGADGPTSAGQRSWSDSEAPLGYAPTRTLERVLSSCGFLNGAPVRFEAADDVAKGGVLCALPALLGEGLLRHTRQYYVLPPGYYPLETIFLLLGLLALVRCPSLEQTRYEAPGEWGRLLGLDRLPEVKTLRAKLATLCQPEGRAAQWQSQLAKEWMAGSEVDDPALAGLYYADGHVRVYHGGLTALPRRYMSRLRLCLRGTTDYWVNGLGGEPFFVITQTVNPGLVTVLREQIVPRLLAEAPQPSEAALQADPQAVRFTIVVDREGYSPALFAELAEARIAILTYHKHPGEAWPAPEFVRQTVRLHTGQELELELAERPASLRNGLALREVRVLDEDGSQSSILTTHPELNLKGVAAGIKARWSQENYLKYMKTHFGLDRLIEYGVTPLPETTVVINPAYRRLDQEVRRDRATLTRLRAQFGAHGLPENPTPAQTQAFELAGGVWRQKLVAQEAVLAARIQQRKPTPRRLTLQELPAAERFGQLCPESKHFIDTIKMIAYRAESALAGEVRESLAREDDARALLRRLFITPVNLRPDPVAKTLTVEVHRLGSALQDAAVAHLCTMLTQTETCFPTTDLRLIYRQVGSI
jgi:hypothetical protein